MKGTPLQKRTKRRKEALRSAGEATASTATSDVDSNPKVETRKSTCE